VRVLAGTSIVSATVPQPAGERGGRAWKCRLLVAARLPGGSPPPLPSPSLLPLPLPPQRLQPPLMPPPPPPPPPQLPPPSSLPLQPLGQQPRPTNSIDGRTRAPQRRATARRCRCRPNWVSHKALSAARGSSREGGRGTPSLRPAAWLPRARRQPPRISVLSLPLLLRACRRSLAATWMAAGAAASPTYPIPSQRRRGGGCHPVG